MVDGNMNTGTKAVSLVLMGNELTAIISDARRHQMMRLQL